jgi:hypothetical protein
LTRYKSIAFSSSDEKSREVNGKAVKGYMSERSIYESGSKVDFMFLTIVVRYGEKTHTHTSIK